MFSWKSSAKFDESVDKCFVAEKKSEKNDSLLISFGQKTKILRQKLWKVQYTLNFQILKRKILGVDNKFLKLRCFLFQTRESP